MKNNIYIYGIIWLHYIYILYAGRCRYGNSPQNLKCHVRRTPSATYRKHLHLTQVFEVSVQFPSRGLVTCRQQAYGSIREMSWLGKRSPPVLIILELAWFVYSDRGWWWWWQWWWWAGGVVAIRGGGGGRRKKAATMQRQWVYTQLACEQCSTHLG